MPNLRCCADVGGRWADGRTHGRTEARLRSELNVALLIVPSCLRSRFRALKSVPFWLTVTRAALVPIMVCLALFYPSKAAFGSCLIVAFVSDIFDGVIARRLGVATPDLRRLDSAVDTLFYLSAVFSAWYLYPQVILSRMTPLVVLGVLEISRYCVDWVKFGREASYHMWSSKLWGIALFVGFFSLLALGSANVTLSLAIYLGIVADLEGLAISAVLPHWRADVPTVVHAFNMK